MEDISRDERFRGARSGIASGRVVARNGDYFGPPVNLAARLTEVAEPGQILTDETTARILGDRARPDGTRNLRGLDDPQPVARLVSFRDDDGERPGGGSDGAT
jgi:adenylate cyclase